MLQIKIVGGALALASLLAGTFVWIVIGLAHVAWKESQRPPSRLRPQVTTGQVVAQLGATTLVCVALHLGTWVALRRLTRQDEFLGFSRGGWRALVILSYATGFVTGGFVVLNAPA